MMWPYQNGLRPANLSSAFEPPPGQLNEYIRPSVDSFEVLEPDNE